MKKKIAILTGAGISAESGIKTFRGAGGLWEGHKVEDVASPGGWYRNRELVLKFYNERRAQLHTVFPNAAHKALAELDEDFEVCVITQNVDDLHERGGSKRVLHLHGELLKARSTVNPSLVYDWPGDINLGDQCDEGSQLRPHIVWFGEAVPMLDPAIQITALSDYFIIIGTSMQVYPAASLIEYVRPEVPKFFIDPYPQVNQSHYKNLEIIEKKATDGVPELVNLLKKES
ncbi:MAG: Sir2 family NAD-dependent protein deacetylase [Bacteroidota bacterium]